MYSVQQANLVAAYGAFFQQWDWDHYATLTFGSKLSTGNCLRHWEDFINCVSRLTHGRVGWVRADEQRWSGCGTPQVPLQYHALLKYEHVPAPKAVAALWKARAGDGQVEAYCSGGGADYYVAKMFPYEGTGYDLGGLEHFPPSEDCPIRGSVS